jgi:hypothetical protein
VLWRSERLQEARDCGYIAILDLGTLSVESGVVDEQLFVLPLDQREQLLASKNDPLAL